MIVLKYPEVFKQLQIKRNFFDKNITQLYYQIRRAKKKTNLR